MITIGLTVLKAENPEWLWAVQGGGNNYNSGEGVAVDTSGNIYTTGAFQGNANFGSLTLSSSGNYDAYLVKYDRTGVAIWARKIGGSSIDRGISVTIGSNGNIYVTGFFSGTVNTDVGTFTSFGLRDIFIAKFNNGGTLLWMHHLGSTGTDEGNGIVADNLNQRIYVNGKFYGTLNLTGTNETLVSTGAADVVVASYSFEGSFLWAKKAGGSQNDFGFGIGTDQSGFLYGTAMMTGTSTFGNFTLNTNGSTDIVVFKMNHEGNWIWAKNYGGSFDELAWRIAVNQNGDQYITGVFSSNAISFGSHLIANTSIMQDMFVFKQNADGEPLWAISGGGQQNDYGRAIAIDPLNFCYVVGDFKQQAFFGTHQLTAVDENDLFVLKISPDGTILWAKAAGGPGSQTGYAAAVDLTNNLVTTGFFTTSMTFDNISLIASNEQPIFIAKLKLDVATNVPTPIVPEQVHLVPNPVQNSMKLQDKLGQAVFALSLKIINSDGREVMSYSGNPLQTIDLSKLVPGVYVMFAETTGGTLRTKFVKQ